MVWMDGWMEMPPATVLWRAIPNDKWRSKRGQRGGGRTTISVGDYTRNSRYDGTFTLKEEEKHRRCRVFLYTTVCLLDSHSPPNRIVVYLCVFCVCVWA